MKKAIITGSNWVSSYLIDMDELGYNAFVSAVVQVDCAIAQGELERSKENILMFLEAMTLGDLNKVQRYMAYLCYAKKPLTRLFDLYTRIKNY